MRLNISSVTLIISILSFNSVPGQSEVKENGANVYSELPIQQFVNKQLVVKELPGSMDILAQVIHYIGLQPLSVDNFKLDHYRQSPQGHHYLFHLYQDGVPCESRFIRVFVDKRLVLRLVAYKLVGFQQEFIGSFPDEEMLRSRLVGLKHVGDITRVWLFKKDQWLPVLKVAVVEDLAAFAEFRYFDADYTVVHRRDNSFRFQGKDSTVQGKVFNPDPLTHAQVPYGGEYQDFNDADSPAINNQRIWRPIVADFHNGLFYLRDSVFRFEELESPISSQPLMSIPVFDFNRSQQEFEFVNAFYHLQTQVRRVHDLGYNLPNSKIQVDPHAASGADVSAFTMAYGDPAIIFGEGGIDDAEDADVIVHELGHALSFAAAPNTANGGQRLSMEEGNCDYFAMSYSRRVNPYNWQKTFNWDGNITWQGRVANSTKLNPNDYNPFNKYSNAEIWVSALSEIFDNLGADITDRMVLCALYNQFDDMMFTHMANICLQCDSIQSGGANSAVIFNAFNRRGLTIPLGFKQAQNNHWRLVNSAGFAFQNENLWVDFGEDRFTGIIEVFDIHGKSILNRKEENVNRSTIEALYFPPGTYLLRVTSSSHNSASFLINRQ